MINIAFMVTTLRSSGPVNILYGLVKYLDKTKYNPYIITLKEELGSSRFNDFVKIGVNTTLIKCNNIQCILGRNKKLDIFLQENNIDIIHTHCAMSSIMVTNFQNSKIKIITTIHCDFKTYFNITFKFYNWYFYYILYKRSLLKMDKVISCGKSLTKLNYENAHIVSTSVVNGIDTEMFIKSFNTSKYALRKKLNLLNEKKYFIVTSTNNGKNTEFLVNFFKSRKNTNDILIILGNGDIREEILKNEYPNIICPGKVTLNEVGYYLRASDYFISASRSEGMPNAVLEALYYELPVLLSDIDPHREILNIAPSDYIGEIFKNDSFEILEEKVSKLKNYNFSSRNFLIIKKYIDAKRMAKEYENEYIKLLKKGKK